MASRPSTTPSSEQLDTFLRAGRVREVSCSGHALVRSRSRFNLSFEQPAQEARFELCEQARGHLLAGRWSHYEPWWTRKPLLRARRKPSRQQMRWCWDERRERCFLMVFDRSWKIVTCLHRRRWATPLALLALRHRPQLAAVERLNACGTHGLLRVAAFRPELAYGRRPRYGALLSGVLAPLVERLVLDFDGVGTFGDEEMLHLLTVVQRRLDPRGELVFCNRELPEPLLHRLAATFGLRPVPEIADRFAGETLRLWRPVAAAGARQRVNA